MVFGVKWSFYQVSACEFPLPPGSQRQGHSVGRITLQSQPPTRLPIWMRVPLKMTLCAASPWSHPTGHPESFVLCQTVIVQTIPKQPAPPCSCCQAGPAPRSTSWLWFPRQEAGNHSNDSQSQGSKFELSKCGFL